jgi:all-trans-retinol 13,14-reductase
MDKPRKPQAYARQSVHDSYDAIVVGSGIGGLAAAALLAKRGGKRVLVLERHYTLGGYTHVFHRPGYEWDVGVHYIGGVQRGSVLRGVFDEITDGALDWADMGPVYDRIVIGTQRYEFPKGKENLRAMLEKSFPGERGAIAAYFDRVDEVVASMPNFFMEKALPPAIARLAGPFLRRKFLRLASRTTREVLKSLTRNQRLIAVLTGQWGDYGLPPAQSSFAIHALVSHHYFDGGFYPVGGAGRIAETILPVIEAAGGRALINAEVDEIVLEGGRVAGVRMARDRAIMRAPLVVSDAGVTNTFASLLSADTAARFGLTSYLQRVRPSVAHACLYVGLRHSARELELPRANLWVYPDENHERSFATALSNSTAALPLVYISFPSAKDPDFERRHPGRATIDIITLSPYERFAAVADGPWKRRGVAYESLKERIARQLLECLYTQVPQVRGKVDVYELSTPMSTRHFANYQRGELYGIDHTPARFQQRFLRPKTAVPGLYLTGQDVSSCGVAGALMGGVLSASAILGRNLLSAIERSVGTSTRPDTAVPPSDATGEIPASAA